MLRRWLPGLKHATLTPLALQRGFSMPRRKRKRRRGGKYALKRIGVHELDKEIDWSVCYTKNVNPGDPLSPSGLVRLAKDGRNGKIVTQVAGMCTWCGQKVPPRRTTWCSNVCVRAYSLTQTTTLREAVYTRDRGVCSCCGEDTDAVKKLVAEWHERFDGDLQEVATSLSEYGLETTESVAKHITKRRTLWDMDHIQPVSKGGDIFALDNLHTLCYWCHKEKTKKEASKNA